MERNAIGWTTTSKTSASTNLTNHLLCRSMKFALVIGCLCAAAVAQPVEEPSPPNYEVKIVKTWIAMPDGVHLAASLYMPAGYMPAGGKTAERFPVLLEYLPYRKDDGTASATIPCI